MRGMGYCRLVKTSRLSACGRTADMFSLSNRVRYFVAVGHGIGVGKS